MPVSAVRHATPAAMWSAGGAVAGIAAGAAVARFAPPSARPLAIALGGIGAALGIFTGVQALRGSASGSPAAPAPSTPADGHTPAPTAGADHARSGAALPVRETRSTGVPLDPAHTTAADITKVFAAPGHGWQAADATYSVPLPDGRIAWLFGDTLLDATAPDGAERSTRMVRNSIVIQGDGTATTLMSGTSAAPSSFLQPPVRDGSWYWPGDATVEGNTLKIFAARMQKTATGAPGWNFQQVGTDLITLDLADMSVISNVPVNRAAPGSHASVINWGATITEDAHHTYVYGVETAGYDKIAHVMRYPKGAVGEAPAEYFDGKAWVSDEKKSAAIAHGVSDEFSVVKTTKGWSLVTQQSFFGHGITAGSGPTPAGPFTADHVIAQTADAGAGHITYNAFVHPELAHGGTVVVSYNRNAANGALDFAHPERYRPGFLDVPTSGLSG